MDQGSQNKLRERNAFVGYRRGNVTHVPRANDRRVVAYRCSNSRCLAEWYGSPRCPYCNAQPGESFVQIVRG